MTTMHDNVMIGTEVVTRDGETLGTVKEVQNGAVKIDASMQPDYWLSTDSVTSVSGNTATVAFVKDDLDHYKREDPIH
jgi:hypothetical protein